MRRLIKDNNNCNNIYLKNDTTKQIAGKREKENILFFCTTAHALSITFAWSAGTSKVIKTSLLASKLAWEALLKLSADI